MDHFEVDQIIRDIKHKKDNEYYDCFMDKLYKIVTFITGFFVAEVIYGMMK